MGLRVSGDTGRRNPGGGGIGLPVMGDNAPLLGAAVPGPVPSGAVGCGGRAGPGWAWGGRPWPAAGGAVGPAWSTGAGAAGAPPAVWLVAVPARAVTGAWGATACAAAASAATVVAVWCCASRCGWGRSGPGVAPAGSAIVRAGPDNAGGAALPAPVPGGLSPGGGCRGRGGAVAGASLATLAPSLTSAAASPGVTTSWRAPASLGAAPPCLGPISGPMGEA
jgi:hypothetical protein